MQGLVFLHIVFVSACIWLAVFGGFCFFFSGLCLVQDEQLLSHESKLKQMSLELEEHRKNSPSDDPKSREWEEFRLKEHYLTYEVKVLFACLLFLISVFVLFYVCIAVYNFWYFNISITSILI